MEKLHIFAELNSDELGKIKPYFQEETYEEGDTVFPQRAPGGSMYMVSSGAVELSIELSPGLSKTILTLTTGGVFGEISLFNNDPRSASAVATEKTELFVLDTPGLIKIIEEEAAISSKILKYLTVTLSERLRETTDLYRQALDWSLSISGALDLDFQKIIDQEISISVLLNNGKEINGLILKIDKHDAGHLLIVKTTENKHVFIPYQAITMISAHSDDIPLSESDIL